MIELRDYQIEMLDRLQRTWREGKRSVMVQMPTGTGKTVLLAEVLRELRNEKIKELKSPFGGVVIVAHRRELIQQIQETLNRLEIKNEKVTEKNESGGGVMPVVVESIQKLSRHLDEVEMEPALVVIDEAHHALAKTYKALWERWPKAKFLGLTATPCRLDGTAFTDLFDMQLQSKDIQWFIKEGWLSDFEYVSVQPDSEELRKVKALKKRGADGDYQTKEMATVLDCPESIEHLYDTYNIYARGKKGIVYAIDRAHAQHIAAYYSAHGVRCAVIDTKTAAPVRLQLVQAYRGHDLDVLINVDIFSEGFDCPEVEFIQLARPTLSLSKYLQQVGRGMRVSKGKPYVTILDQVGLYQTFGMPTDNRDWQKMFSGKVYGKGQAEGEGRPLIIRDEVADKELLNLEMLHIKRFNERRTRLEVFLQNGRFGVMCMGHVTCSPQFRRIQRLHRSRYYALAVYDGMKENYTTVIDSEGRNMRLAFPSAVTVRDDFFIYEDKDGKKLYYDAIGRQPYYKLPQFKMVAGLEVTEMHDEYFLRDRADKLIFAFKRENIHYNDYIVITEDVLINKTDDNRQRKIQAYLGDSILVTAYKGIGYQQVHTDGSLGKVFTQLPQKARTVPEWKRLGLQTLSTVSQEEREEQRRENLKWYYDQLVENMVKSDNSDLDELLGYGFQIIHEKHVAGKFDFINRTDVRFIDIQTLSYETEDKGNTAAITGQQKITYFRQRQQKTEPYNFRITLKSMNGSWKISGIKYWKEKKKEETR